MRLTTLCYIEQNDHYLMLHRIKKQADINKDKWIGIGGKFENGESPEECLLREAREETGLTLKSWKFHGIITFILDNRTAEYIFLYTSNEFEGELLECPEGRLEWVLKEQIDQLNLWQGDKIFFGLIARGHPVFSLKLQYQGEQMIYAALDGKVLTEGEDY